MPCALVEATAERIVWIRALAAGVLGLLDGPGHEPPLRDLRDLLRVIRRLLGADPIVRVPGLRELLRGPPGLLDGGLVVRPEVLELGLTRLEVGELLLVHPLRLGLDLAEVHAEARRERDGHGRGTDRQDLREAL